MNRNRRIAALSIVAAVAFTGAGASAASAAVPTKQVTKQVAEARKATVTDRKAADGEKERDQLDRKATVNSGKYGSIDAGKYGSIDARKA